MLKLPEKGSEGYFGQKKKINGIATAISFLLVILIYVTGIFLYHTNKSIFTVMAAVCVLPAAKAAVSYLILVSCHSATKDQCRQVQALVSDIPAASVLYDILLASEERSLMAGMIVIINGNILMFTEDKKANPAATEKYVKKLLENCNYSSVKQYLSFDTFFQRVSNLAHSENANHRAGDEKESIRMQTMCERIKKQLLIYAI
jgi:hypothetical protein